MLDIQDPISATTGSTSDLPFDMRREQAPRFATRHQLQRGLLKRLFRQQSLRWFALLAVVELGLLILAPWLASSVALAAAS
jgi:hypothetical protein